MSSRPLSRSSASPGVEPAFGTPPPAPSSSRSFSRAAVRCTAVHHALPRSCRRLSRPPVWAKSTLSTWLPSPSTASSRSIEVAFASCAYLRPRRPPRPRSELEPRSWQMEGSWREAANAPFGCGGGGVEAGDQRGARRAHVFALEGGGGQRARVDLLAPRVDIPRRLALGRRRPRRSPQRPLWFLLLCCDARAQRQGSHDLGPRGY